MYIVYIILYENGHKIERYHQRTYVHAYNVLSCISGKNAP